jgi:formylmethanofuran dehydrogenase subunit E
MDLIEVAKKRDEIMASQNIKCPKCGEHQYAPFDKLYVTAYGICYMCTPCTPGPEEDEIVRRGDNILTIIEA